MIDSVLVLEMTNNESWNSEQLVVTHLSLSYIYIYVIYIYRAVRFQHTLFSSNDGERCTLTLFDHHHHQIESKYELLAIVMCQAKVIKVHFEIPMSYVEQIHQLPRQYVALSMLHHVFFKINISIYAPAISSTYSIPDYYLT